MTPKPHNIYLSKTEKRALVILSSPQDPYGLLLAEFDTTASEMPLRSLRALSLRALTEEP